MTVTATAIRLAAPDEIDVLVAIDHDATALYTQAGLIITLTADHPFAVSERDRWLRAIHAGQVLVALGHRGEPVGFAALGELDDKPYLDQLSVRVAAMGRGIGSLLLEHAWQRSLAAGQLWLTTYAHLRFNRPFYERAGFRVATEGECGPQITETLRQQRLTLPAPEQRVAMVRTASP